jgi:hypothetical protein
LFVLLAGVLLFAAFSSAGPLNARREEHGLVLPPLPETVRPSVLLGPLLAVGRAPLVDYLWMRAMKLKDEGLYFDAYQLSQMICELQPKFASVWAFQAWNMSYNISVTLKTPEERWRWVRNGYELLRDKAIPLNPNNTQLYKELAWILFHKVGDFMDEWHYYYKLQFALQMEDILGQPPEGYVQPGRVRGDFYRDYDYRSLAEAPLSYPGLLEDQGVADFVARLERFGFEAGKDGAFLGLLAALKEGTVQVPNAAVGQEQTRLDELKQLMSDPDFVAAGAALESFWRAYRLRDEVRLDPQRIVRLQDGFGVTLDFRLPGSHALYWANMGLEKGADRQQAIDVHRLNTNRIEFYCLQKMFHRGRMAMSTEANLGEPPLLSPDLRVIPILFDAFQRDSREYLVLEKQQGPVSTNFVTGFVGFARSAAIRYHELGRQEEARKMFDFLKENFPDPMYAQGLDGFLALQFMFDRENLDLRTALARVHALIRRGLYQYAYDEDELAGRYFQRAKEVYDLYESTMVSERMKIPFSYPEILRRSAHDIGGRMRPSSYARICQKLGLEPIPREQVAE